MEVDFDRNHNEYDNEGGNQSATKWPETQREHILRIGMAQKAVTHTHIA